MSRWNSRILIALLLTLFVVEPRAGQESRGTLGEDVSDPS
ncbi:MAG: hypothetical protein Ct9H300mP15_21500 [Gemmatimonadota bacterium]|nr:MAG: hypothetical protein Ct9H300mP15_21500 [Gemmatimonadota bacterium]